MRLLVLMDSASGVSFHRLFTPYARMQQDYDIQVEVSQHPPSWINIDFSLYDAVIFNRWISVAQYNIFEKLSELDIPTICDVDDYWVVPKSNPAYRVYKKMIKNATKDAILNATHITSSTTLLAEKIKEINTNITILPNALDLTQNQWTFEKAKNEKLTIGWVGGITHLEDLKRVGNSVKRFCEENDAIFYMAGYHTESHEWQMCEKTITGESIENRPNWFKTIRGTTPTDYGTSYSLFDFCIAPLQDTNFNQYKSELKIVEAAAYNLPIIVSNVKPYTLHEGNKGVIFAENNEQSWYDCICRMAKLNIGDLNTEYCNQHHNLKSINQTRYELLKSLCK
jgi:glycosyltransferase involved in cell wall biosynthesis